MIKNKPSINDEKHLNNLREASKNRGLWYYFLLKEIKESGLDINLARQGIREIGHFNGHNKYLRTQNLKEFVKAFMDEIPKKMFEMELVKLTDKEAIIHFHYCSMCAMWQNFEEMEKDNEFISEICDIAMEVDRGLFDTYYYFEFILGDKIADEKEVCQITIRKK